MKKIVLLFLGVVQTSFGQYNNPNPGYWQQHVDYKMDVEVDVNKYTYTGTQELVYTNNSPDTLKKVFYHLYFNAFRPGSEMDARLQSISDPDARMMVVEKDVHGKTVKKSAISVLKPEEMGFLYVYDLKQDGLQAETKVVGTILEVTLPKPIAPKSQSKFTLKFDGQVPKMIRRAGRNSEEGVVLSMAQWYPKMAEFDFEGWHADPYIGREFHGVWGNFDVKITIDKNYILGASGYLQNPNEIGFGYEDEGVKVKIPKKQKTRTWHFVAPNVHDFTWAADPNYIHDKKVAYNGVVLHFLYKNNPKIIENWKKLQGDTEKLLELFNRFVGPYPYKQYSVIQGGDGGMEYAMCTLITGERTYNSLLGVTAHELAHSWFQHVLATNESKHEWMDEGFTSFISDYAIHVMNEEKGKEVPNNPFIDAYDSYSYMVMLGKQNPLSTHADRYDNNMIYGISAYNKGTLFLTQLGYIIGWENLFKTLQKFYADYKFSHPTPNDFKRTAERVTGANLDWFLVDWTQTTNIIDYEVKEVKEENGKTQITLERHGNLAMPIDLIIEFEDGSAVYVYIPNTLMRWEKPNPYKSIDRIVLAGWDWAHSTYTFAFETAEKKVKKVHLDPSGFMANMHQVMKAKK